MAGAEGRIELPSAGAPTESRLADEGRALAFGGRSAGEEHVLQSSANKAGDHPEALEAAGKQFKERFSATLKPHYENVDQAITDFLKRRDLPDRDKIEILASLTDIIEGNGLENPHMTDPVRRSMAAAGVIDNLAYPHWIDQGAHPTCAFASKEERNYSGLGGANTDAVRRTVEGIREIVLKGTASGRGRFDDQETTVGLEAGDFTPDYEAKDDQGRDDYRNYASQLWQFGAMRNPDFDRQRLAILTSNKSSVDLYGGTDKIYEQLEERPFDLIVSPDSMFNTVLSGSNPYRKIFSHSLSIYRQRDSQGNPMFRHDGEPLYFISNQAGKRLDIRDLTRRDLELRFSDYDGSSLPSIFKAGPREGLEDRYSQFTQRWSDIIRRKRLGVGADEREAKWSKPKSLPKLEFLPEPPR